MVPISFLRRLLGLGQPPEPIEFPPLVPPSPPVPEPAPTPRVACPYCGVVLEPPPDHTRLCPRCHRRVVVRHSEGRAIYLTEAAVEVFEAARQHDLDEQTWARGRRRWLQLAQFAGAPIDRRKRLAAAPLSAAVVQASRSLYLAAAERAVRAARRERHWDDVARIRSRQAAALFEEAGNEPPPADEIVALYREGVTATLRAIAPISREVELVGASCCAACRADSDRIFKVADELRTPRLPHAGCPRGLCACDWWPALRKPVTKRRRRAPAPAPQAVVAEPSDRPMVDDAAEGDGPVQAP
ncbi:MAG: hypothetical protein ACHQZR_07315 [Candidatus Limnocylindrales bacterium]